MNILDLYSVEFAKPDTLAPFLLENAMEHQQFAQAIYGINGTSIPQYPIFDLNPENFDDWLQLHALMHQAEANALGLDFPPWLLDVNFDVETDFYDWMGNHAALHQFTVDRLGITS